MGKNKYGNRKIKANGIVFDSKLEKYAYDLFNKFNIKFEYQVEWELMPKYRTWDGKAVRRIYMRIGFVINHNGKKIFIDTKGYATDTSKIKYKLLGYQAKEREVDHEIIWLKTEKKVRDFVLDWYDKNKNNGNS